MFFLHSPDATAWAHTCDPSADEHLYGLERRIDQGNDERNTHRLWQQGQLQDGAAQLDVLWQHVSMATILPSLRRARHNHKSQIRAA